MNFEALISVQLWAMLALFGVVFFVRRLVWRLRGRFGFYPRGAAFGNALQRLQVMVQPEVRYVIREKEDESVDGEDSGDPDHPIDPIAHLHRQARRIRRGEEVDQITAVVGGDGGAEESGRSLPQTIPTLNPSEQERFVGTPS